MKKYWFHMQRKESKHISDDIVGKYGTSNKVSFKIPSSNVRVSDWLLIEDITNLIFFLKSRRN